MKHHLYRLLPAVTGFFRLGLIPSLLLFLITAQFAAVVLITYLFESELTDMPWQYAVMTIPSTIAAWYFSVYHVWVEEHAVSTNNKI